METRSVPERQTGKWGRCDRMESASRNSLRLPVEARVETSSCSSSPPVAKTRNGHPQRKTALEREGSTWEGLQHGWTRPFAPSLDGSDLDLSVHLHLQVPSSRLQLPWAGSTHHSSANQFKYRPDDMMKELGPSPRSPPVLIDSSPPHSRSAVPRCPTCGRHSLFPSPSPRHQLSPAMFTKCAQTSTQLSSRKPTRPEASQPQTERRVSCS